ncbi:MAG: histidine kinase [Gemmatimonadales bacterium]
MTNSSETLTPRTITSSYRMPRSRAWRALAGAVLLFVGWTIFGLLSSAHFFLADSSVRDVRSFVDLADNVMIFYWAWAILTPLAIYIINRIVRRHASLWMQAAELLTIGVALIFVHGMLHINLVRLFAVDLSKHVDASGLSAYAVRHGGGDLATFAVLAGACYLVEATRKSREREIASSLLQSRLAKADLEILRWRLQPHFLFNALNTVSTLVLKGDTLGADKAIGLISGYLRSALEQQPDTTVLLSDELAMIERYIEIERLRFGDAMRIEVDIAESALTARLPGQIIQPLVENAIIHGGLPGGSGEPIRISAYVDAGRLHIDVRNSVEAAVDGHNGEVGGFGLRYVRERLRHFYGRSAAFDLSTADDHITATLDIPA